MVYVLYFYLAIDPLRSGYTGTRGWNRELNDDVKGFHVTVLFHRMAISAERPFGWTEAERQRRLNDECVNGDGWKGNDPKISGEVTSSLSRSVQLATPHNHDRPILNTRTMEISISNDLHKANPRPTGCALPLSKPLTNREYYKLCQSLLARVTKIISSL